MCTVYDHQMGRVPGKPPSTFLSHIIKLGVVAVLPCT